MVRLIDSTIGMLMLVLAVLLAIAIPPIAFFGVTSLVRKSPLNMAGDNWYIVQAIVTMSAINPLVWIFLGRLLNHILDEVSR